MKGQSRDGMEVLNAGSAREGGRKEEMGIGQKEAGLTLPH